jgi:hypothetical protein
LISTAVSSQHKLSHKWMFIAPLTITIIIIIIIMTNVARASHYRRAQASTKKRRKPLGHSLNTESASLCWSMSISHGSVVMLVFDRALEDDEVAHALLRLSALRSVKQNLSQFIACPKHGHKDPCSKLLSYKQKYGVPYVVRQREHFEKGWNGDEGKGDKSLVYAPWTPEWDIPLSRQVSASKSYDVEEHNLMLRATKKPACLSEAQGGTQQRRTTKEAAFLL